MKRDTSLLLVIVAVISVFLVSHYWKLLKKTEKKVVEQPEESLVLAADIGTPPYYFYTCKDGKKQEDGLDYEISSQLAQKLHKKLIVKNILRKDAFNALRDGVVDLVGPSTAITDERLKDFTMVYVYGTPNSYIYMMFLYSAKFKEFENKKEATIHDVKALIDSGPVGVVAGSTWEEQLKKYKVKNIVSYEYEQDLIFDLKKGKVPVAFLGKASSELVNKQHPEVQLLLVALDNVWKHGAGFAIKKNRPEFIKQVDEAIKQLRQEGIIDQLQVKWFGRVY